MKQISIILLIFLSATSSVFPRNSYQQQLNENGALLGDVVSAQVSPDNSTVVYIADQDTDSVDELCTVPIGGGPSTKLNGAFVETGGVQSAQ
ncbi:MAG: hypothetical protein MK312_13900, partial [Roseibacillus sp.]|nr:hypothetical protein [Roseibacillus sp.]